MTWRVLNLERVHDGDVVSLDRAEVELTDGTRIDWHDIVRVSVRVVSLVLRNTEGRYLLLRRHRFIVDRWCWDVAAGKIAEGEAVVEAARRAAIEETGWRPALVREVASYHPNPGLSDQVFTVCVGDGAERVGDPDPNEAEQTDWVQRDEVLSRIQRGEIDGLSLTSLLITFVTDLGQPTS